MKPVTKGIHQCSQSVCSARKVATQMMTRMILPEGRVTCKNEGCNNLCIKEEQGEQKLMFSKDAC